MKLTWNKNKNNKKRPLTQFSNLPFDQDNSVADEDLQKDGKSEPPEPLDIKHLAQSFQSQGNKLAEDGKYREALGKWEAALNMMPENAVLHEQKAQVLLEIGDAWNALKAATRATELEPSWAEAWITLGRAQLNFGELDSAIESFDKALAIKPDSEEVQDDRKAAFHLVKRRKQLHLSGLNTDTSRFVVGDKTETS
ncbi:tetratricopeptide repeat protein 33 [Mangifera indica]|uniref:tetratricopeptide repeat protein 33 n=1 Tax=Mangifera indica TaxID=29780 RepID=UPI001CFBF168|nr:tetratricopeptide repeat protein 33 [Mangifera indica]